ncbi:MAG: 3-hydroxyacyl-CoA dehydrogenase family protein [Xanthobacteraceae bacterium]|nr:3-hydroxyacyl-CoA dehydrogenase family protein [Xanthobacteraceae bacterium]
MKYAFETAGESRSFPNGDAFLNGAVGRDQADVVIYSGPRLAPDPRKTVILIELGEECLGDHIDDDNPAHANVLGFARYRNGDDPPSRLIELVRHPKASEAAIAAARDLFAAAGLEVSLCNDQVGRIINRLVVPKYNAALRFLDEGLATQADMDLTCKLGLGYPDGPIERVVRGGLAPYYQVSKGLFEAFGTSAFAPPRRARIAFKQATTGTAPAER